MPPRSSLLALLLLGCQSDFQVVAEPKELTVSPALTDLGALPVGEETLFTIDLVAPRAAVEVVSVDVYNVEGDWFSVVNDELPEVPRDDSATLTLRYAPQEAGFHWATITVLSDADKDASQEVSVRAEAAEGSARLLPTLLDLGPAAEGSEVTGALTLLNEGRLDLTLSEVAWSGDDGFALDESLPLTVPAGEELELAVSYAAAHEDEVSAELDLTLDAGVVVEPARVQANACSSGGGPLYDQDGDGFSICATDCDDLDADSHPGGEEVCDDADNDCDGVIDEGTSCSDDDGDGWTEDDGDCNDGDEDVSPDAEEDLTNGVDDDCDGVTDSGTTDGDGDGYTTAAGDCDDSDSSTYTGAPESADGVDNDCDGTVDEGTSAYDDDGDGMTEDDGDCDDTDDTVYSGADEEADWVDDDCDGTVDEGTDYYDDDGDGWTEEGGDCDDSDASTNPGETEVVGDGIDNDCNGVRW